MYIKVKVEKLIFFTVGQIIEAGEGGRRLRIVEEFGADPHAGGFVLEVDLNNGDGFQPEVTGPLEECQAEARGILEGWILDTIRIDPDEEYSQKAGA